MANKAFWLFHVVVILICCVLYVTSGLKPTVSSGVFDAYIFLAYLLVLYLSRFRLTVESIILLLFGVVYLGLQYYFYMQYSEYTDLYTFLRSSRFAIYLILFASIVSQVERFDIDVGASINPGRFILPFLVLVLLVYVFQVVFLGAERPALYSENNYEVPSILLLAMLFLSEGAAGLSRFKTSLLAVVLAVFSKSKSGVLEAFVYFYRLQAKRSLMEMLVIGSAVAAVMLPVVVYVFLSRSAGESIFEADRFKFLAVYIDIAHDLSIVELLFGRGIADALPIYACLDLEYWARGMFNNHAYCDAVVFHSLLIKQLYDIGWIGAIIFFLAWFYYIARCFSSSKGMTVFLIVAICSLSVSGFSNSIVIWPLFLAAFFKKVRTSG